METGPTGKTYLLLVATLVARLAQQLAVLLLRHPLAALLNNGTHRLPPIALAVAQPRERENTTLERARAKLRPERLAGVGGSSAGE